MTSILHSPRRRAQKTADQIASLLPGATVQASDLLDDRTPVPSPQHRRDYPQKYWDWLAATPEEERDVDGQQITRAAGRLAEIARASSDGTIVAVTHSFVIGWILRAALDAPTAAWLRLAPANAGLTFLECTATGVGVVSYNDTGHLVAL